MHKGFVTILCGCCDLALEKVRVMAEVTNQPSILCGTVK